MKGAVLGLALALTMASAAADDEICSRLSAFEAAPQARSIDKLVPQRDWIELRWTGAWLSDEGWGWECTHTDSEASKALCAWLGSNTSMEFHANLPRRILGCHGSQFSRSIGTDTPWIQSISISPETGDEYMLLEIALSGHKGNDAIRYSVFVGPAAEQKNPLPPLFPPSDFTGK